MEPEDFKRGDRVKVIDYPIHGEGTIIGESGQVIHVGDHYIRTDLGEAGIFHCLPDELEIIGEDLDDWEEALLGILDEPSLMEQFPIGTRVRVTQDVYPADGYKIGDTGTVVEDVSDRGWRGEIGVKSDDPRGHEISPISFRADELKIVDEDEADALHVKLTHDLELGDRVIGVSPCTFGMYGNIETIESKSVVGVRWDPHVADFSAAPVELTTVEKVHEAPQGSRPAMTREILLGILRDGVVNDEFMNRDGSREQARGTFDNVAQALDDFLAGEYNKAYDDGRKTGLKWGRDALELVKSYLQGEIQEIYDEMDDIDNS